MEDNQFTVLIGQRIRTIRQQKKMSQADLAFAAETSPVHISNIECGKKQMSLSVFTRILEALQVSADEILRPNIPQVNTLYANEFSDILKDCSPDEVEAILKIVKEVKKSLHSHKNND